jgi:D-alanyl-D-alanine carboxypeptidase
LRAVAATESDLGKFSVMLRALRTQGIRKINGDLILDRSYFQPERLDIGAPPFDEHPDAYYNVIPDALLIHSNLTLIRHRIDRRKNRYLFADATRQNQIFKSSAFQ